MVPGQITGSAGQNGGSRLSQHPHVTVAKLVGDLREFSAGSPRTPADSHRCRMTLTLLHSGSVRSEYGAGEYALPHRGGPPPWVLADDQRRPVRCSWSPATVQGDRDRPWKAHRSLGDD